MEHDKRGVAPVVGVALLIGITVLLSAVVGVFILTTDVQEPVPDVEFSSASNVTEVGGEHRVVSVEFTFRGNERFDQGELEVSFDGDGFLAELDDDELQEGEFFTAGESFEVEFCDVDGADGATGTVRLVWDPADADESAILDSHEVTTPVTGPDCS